MIGFGRDICSTLSIGEQREWLVTNGIGGFASGTVAGPLTRRYHGLLIAALKPPVGRTLLVTRVDEVATYCGKQVSLYTNRWAGGVVEPDGYRYIEQFFLDGAVPVWHFAIGDALLEKRIWMHPDQNTTYVRYKALRGSAPLALKMSVQVNYRDFHSETRSDEWKFDVSAVNNGLKISAFPGATSFYVLSRDAAAETAHAWNRRYFLLREANRGLAAVDDNLHAATMTAEIDVGESVSLVFSTEPDALLDDAGSLKKRRQHEAALLARAKDVPAELSQLVLAAEQFVVRRPLPGDPNGSSIIAGYHWFADWGRDTTIALPGLTLSTGRPEVAAKVLRTFAHFVDAGMLPNRFPDAANDPEYNTADATLWYFEALRAYFAATGDRQLLQQLFPTLSGIIAWHRRGTRYQIKMDAEDGLLYAGEPGMQLTWMDAKVDDWVVTPRQGKPVEINALWYNALHIMAAFARELDTNAGEYAALAKKVQQGFNRFWNEAAGYCYDVVDAPAADGGVSNDASLRPNQLLAVSLTHSPLSPEQQKCVVDICARELLTSHGLRSLAPGHASFQGSYGGSPRQRDGAYHQGTVWAWLIGPFVEAHWKVHGDAAASRSFLEPLLRQLGDHGVGSISEIFEGDPPFLPRGAIAQAWSVAEVLRAWQLTQGGDKTPRKDKT